LVGAWVLAMNADNPSNLQECIVFPIGGAAIGANPPGSDTIGKWQTVGPNTAAVTLVSYPCPCRRLMNRRELGNRRMPGA
jgi:hypothetical protein